MALTFTLLSPNDAGRLSRLLEQWYWVDSQGFDLAAARQQSDRLLSNSRLGHAWIIESENSCIGYAMLTFSAAGIGEPRAYVSALYLAPDWRGKGFGRRTELFLADVAQWLKVRLHAFDVESERKHAHSFSKPFFHFVQSRPELRGAVA
jgi:GNAT superfamily N-acetyltransferase